MSQRPASPFREVLDELDRRILECLKTIGAQKEEALKLADRYIKMRAEMVEPYR